MKISGKVYSRSTHDAKIKTWRSVQRLNAVPAKNGHAQYSQEAHLNFRSRSTRRTSSNLKVPNDWAGTRAREAKSRVARTIFFSDVSLDGLAERTNRHLGEMILQDILYRLCHSNQCWAPRKANSYPRVFSKNTFCFSLVTKFQRVSGICLKWPKVTLFRHVTNPKWR